MTSSLRIFRAFLVRDWAMAKSARWSGVLELGAVVVYAAPFFYLSELLAPTQNSFVDVDGRYFWSVLIGVAYFGVAFACVSQFSKRLREDQLTGTLEALLATPVSTVVVVVATTSFEVLRAFLLSIATIVVAVALFGVRLHLTAETPIGLFIVLPASLVFLVAVGLVLAAVTLHVRRIAPLTGLMVSVLSLLSGTYFPVSQLPAALESIAKICPTTWALQWLRVALLGGTAPAWQVFAVVGCAAVSLPAAAWALERAVRHAKRTGSLVLY